MPTPPPHHVSSLFRISSLGFRISPDPSARITRNEPNLPRHDPNAQNEPNSRPANHQKMQNEPNLSVRRHPAAQTAPIWQNEPNSISPSCLLPIASCLFQQNEPNLPPHDPTIHHSPLTIHYLTKRTQSHKPGCQRNRNKPNYRPIPQLPAAQKRQRSRQRSKRQAAHGIAEGESYQRDRDFVSGRPNSNKSKTDAKSLYGKELRQICP